MQAQDRRSFGERREAGPYVGEGRRIDEVRRIWNRRHGGPGGVTDEGEFDRRGAHPSLFAALGFPLFGGFVVWAQPAVAAAHAVPSCAAGPTSRPCNLGLSPRVDVAPWAPANGLARGVAGLSLLYQQPVEGYP